jgi:putative endonuclease
MYAASIALAEHSMREHTYFVYIMASRSRTLYIGFTSALRTRVGQHKDEVLDGFTKKYQCHRLVYFETFGYVGHAIAREKQLKRWSRAKKLALIQRTNPAWADLSEQWGQPVEPWKEPAGLSAPASHDEASGRDDTE